MAEEQRPLSESELKAGLEELDKRITEINTLLSRGFPIASPQQHLHVQETLKRLQNVFTLYEILDSFRKALGDTESLKKWTPRGGLCEQVLDACYGLYNQRYEEHDIEYIFYTQGGINGVFVLFLGTKSQTQLFPKLNSLPTDMVVELAKVAGKERIPSLYLPAWIGAYDTSKSNLSLPKHF
jgi:hypothetical protein